MPRRKRPSLGRSTAKATSKRQRRHISISQGQDREQEQDQHQDQASVPDEEQEDTQDSLSLCCNSPSSVIRRTRLSDDRARKERERQNQITPQRNARQSRDRERTAAARSEENTPQRNARRSQDQERTATARAVENTPHRESRRASNQRTTANSRRRQYIWDNAALDYDPTIDYATVDVVSIGSMDSQCQHCNALRFPGEPPGICCSNGKVDLIPLQPPPEPLCTFLKGETALSKEFLGKVRNYNACFQMTSFGCDSNCSPSTEFQTTFKVQGQVYHQFGSLLPPSGDEPKFVQIYFMGEEGKECQRRFDVAHGNSNSLKQEEVILPLQRMLHSHNALVEFFQCAIDKIVNLNKTVTFYADKRPTGEHERRYNAPTVDEVAVLAINEDHGSRDIVLTEKSGGCVRVSETHRSYDALQYPLMFWQGEHGYFFGIPHTNPATGARGRGKVSCTDFYAYRVMKRSGEMNYILQFRSLLSQFMVDMYAKIESERLLYIKLNQTKLRADNYIHLKDALTADSNANNAGQRVILPSSFTGGPRDMHQQTQDAMTYVRNFGTPDLFITFTCNPKWKEITELLETGQQPSHRHDIIARVFRQKVIVLKNLIVKSQVFGKVQCYLYTIEWQKRGLPHTHMLYWLCVKLHGNQIDSFISAELPDHAVDPGLFDVVKSQMVHGPCGHLNRRSPCMENNKCKKNYPRLFRAETSTGEDGYPHYRRRKPQDGGHSFTKQIGGNEVEIDNTWIVPYNPLLSKIFQAHINVEFCNSVKSIQYICKYVHKGSDMAVISTSSPEDEVENFKCARYISSNEAAWRIFKFPIHERSPKVEHLAVHLENMQRVYFTEHNAAQRVQNPPDTTLTAFFKLCDADEFAKTLLYSEVPKYFTWCAAQRRWKRRVQGQRIDGVIGVRAADTLGRVYTIHPSQFECFCLRMLLHVVRGPTSFKDLKTVDETLCATFSEACNKRGMMEDDGHWEAALQEAEMCKSPSPLRSLFAIMVCTCGLTDPLGMWESHKEGLTEDFLHQARQHVPDATFSDSLFQMSLASLQETILSLSGKKLSDFGLPSPPENEDRHMVSEYIRETSYDPAHLQRFIDENEQKLNDDQQFVYAQLLEVVQTESAGLFFFDAPGGTGKTFLINLLLAKVRRQLKIAVAVASSGIAATLLPGGRTAHSTFKLSLKPGDAKCSISKSSPKAKLLKDCKLIVWDECTMSHKTAFEAVDSFMKDLKENELLMGGVPLLMSGDFRQILPVVRKGTRADELHASIKSSRLWKHVTKLKLTINMRVHCFNDSQAAAFSSTLLEIGNGKIAYNSDGLVKVPCGIPVSTVTELQQCVFPSLADNVFCMQWLAERAILAPTNTEVDKINEALIVHMPGEQKSYKSVDTMADIDQLVHYPVEFLNSLQPPGMPPHNLTLKIGAPIMLLRNLDPPRLCNGTRLIVKRLMLNVVQATVMTGKFSGEDVFIPRIPTIPSDTPIEFKRIQFPIRLSFSMTINKAQGQTLKVVGINLNLPCFSHGQFYVACSRVGIGSNLYILAPDGLTKNVVYPEALL